MNEILKAFPNGIPAETMEAAEAKVSERRDAQARIVEIREHIGELYERIEDIEAFLEGKREKCPELNLETDWDYDTYPNG